MPKGADFDIIYYLSWVLKNKYTENEKIINFTLIVMQFQFNNFGSLWLTSVCIKPGMKLSYLTCVCYNNENSRQWQMMPI